MSELTYVPKTLMSYISQEYSEVTPLLSQKCPSKTHSSVNRVRAGGAFQLRSPQSDGMELSAITTTAGWGDAVP